MSFFRKIERRAAQRAKKMVLIPVLNMPWKRLEIPATLRNDILRDNGFVVGDLTGKTPMHAVFVADGLVLALLCRTKYGPRLTLHLVDLNDEEKRQLVGAAICGAWEEVISGPEVLTFLELKSRYDEFAGTAA